MRRVASIVLLIFLLIGILTLALNIQPVKAPVITVPVDYPTIQGAINAADEGDTIFVRNGTYYENVVVNKTNLTLIGENRNAAIIDGNGTGTVLWVMNGTDNVVVTGFTIRRGLYGIFLPGSNNNTITDIFASNNQYSVYLLGSSNNTLTSNIISNSIVGIHLSYSNNNTVLDNLASNSTNGIIMDNSNNNTVSSNTANSNSNCGFYIWLSSNNNTFYHNNFINNPQHVSVSSDSLDNVWDDDYPSGGNYWSNFNGTDLFRGPYQNETGNDGIGDTPYAISIQPLNVDMYPLTGPVGSSTMTGENVTVFPTDDVGVIFESVTAEGSTTVDKSDTGPEPPPEVEIKQYYDILTTASYSGTITIRIIYDDSNMTQKEEENLQLMQHSTIQGDVDGDYDVDIFDIVMIALAYGSEEGEPRYVVQCDIDSDGKVDIFDIVMAAVNYLESVLPEERWVDITTYIDAESNLIIGDTSHLSVFGVT